ncbi:alpha-amylase-like isoform X1 [Biomphalaria glabrata]|uniref:Alpha-amylase n=2 Tax=Biomphalaria glabrata TaxID=6526 RepID=A0A9W3B7S2_BIOGL|nr:alpha-amylase-like isoform X1 [Biomphalaria glabrata]KAI8756399.1 hypothetical protein BgiMline_009914 [Biomphalaria glabrata]
MIYQVLLVTFFNYALSAYTDPHCIGGRDGIVHLFEWKWNDIAAECERFLGPYGYCAVQTSPANENRIVTNPYRPWWERYQPVSYKIHTRSGSEDEFRNMVEKCQKSGVRIYVDVVINHMTESGGQGFGTNGTFYDADHLQFPGVPFGPTDFNDGSLCHSCDMNIHSYGNAEEVRNCRLVGLHGGLLDLKMGTEYVSEQVSSYLNRLVDLGVVGFRVDAAKHMWPEDLIELFNKVKDLPIGGRPFVYQEVIDQGGEPIKAEEYLATGRIINFRFGLQLANVFRRQNAMKYLSNWGTGWGMWASDSVVNFIDNHDNQRGHGGGGGVLTHWEPKPYKMATAFMLAHPYGMPRVMSSYEYNRANNYEGPPHNSDMTTASVQMSGMRCTNGWSCEHRWRQIYNMVGFRNMVSGTALENWWSGADYQIAFSRGDKGFIALNLEGFDVNQNLQTGLPAGRYCDVISGDIENDRCTGKTVEVYNDGTAHINVCSNCDDPVLAIHVGAKIGSPPRRF